MSSSNLAGQDSCATKISSTVRQLLGIPFAEPPMSEHHFRPCVTKKLYADSPRATSFGPSYIQYGNDSSSVFNQYLSHTRGPKVGQSEDCLTLNIGTPLEEEIGDDLLPVTIWISGGALVSGDAAVSSTDVWAYAWPDAPLVGGFIVMLSGAVGNRQSAMNCTENFTYVADQVGRGGLNEDDGLNYMQEVIGTDIIEIYNKYNAMANGGRDLAFGAMADDETIPSNWTERRERGAISKLVCLSFLKDRKKPTNRSQLMLIGSTLSDSTSLYPYTRDAPDQTSVRAPTDKGF